MPRKICILDIDDQLDFVKPPTKDGQGALYVQDAEKQLPNRVNLINRLGSKIDEIVATLDSHIPGRHISIPNWFVDSNGNFIEPFSLVRFKNNRIESYDPVTNESTGEWFTNPPHLYEWTKFYLETLEADGRYPHCIWPPHCEIGSLGAALCPEIFEAFRNWATENNATISFQPKGSNYRVEHFGGVKAQVLDPDDPINTGLNTALINNLMIYDDILLMGEAWNFCLANTAIDIYEFAGEEFARKLILFTDCTTEIEGPGGCFKELTTKFMDKMTGAGMRSMLSTEYLN